MSHHVVECADRNAWLAARQKHLCATDVVAVLGASRYASPYSVWLAKTEPLPPDQPGVLQRCGLFLEPFIAELFCEATGVETFPVSGKPTLCVSQSHPWLAATPDRVTLFGEPVELKTAQFASGEQWKTRVPVEYQLQVQVQLAVLGKERGYIAVLISGSEFRWHEIKRHDKVIDTIHRVGGEFWTEYVEARQAPPVDYREATRQALAAKYPQATKETIELPPELAEVGREFDEAVAAAREADRRKQLAANRVREAMGTASAAALPDGSGFRWSGTPRRFTRARKVTLDGE